MEEVIQKEYGEEDLIKKHGEILKRLPIERKQFADYFGIIKDNCGKDFLSATQFFKDNVYAVVKAEELSFIYCLSVLRELKIFKVEGGKLVFDNGVKSGLDNSAIYRAAKKSREA